MEKMQEYWYWSWDDLVAYELPSVFDFISKETGQKIHYVGHSLVMYHIINICYILK